MEKKESVLRGGLGAQSGRGELHKVGPFLPLLIQVCKQPTPIGDVANSKRPLLIIPKVQLRLRVTRRSATALARYPQKLAKIVCG